MITLGDRGPEVSQLQKYLSLLGYDLVIDGHFGNRTKKSYQPSGMRYPLGEKAEKKGRRASQNESA